MSSNSEGGKLANFFKGDWLLVTSDYLLDIVKASFRKILLTTSLKSVLSINSLVSFFKSHASKSKGGYSPTRNS
jgi:hypothetical protein